MQFYALGGLGCRAAASSEPRLAAHLLAASENIRAEVGASVMSFLVPVLAHGKGSAMAALGPSRFDAEFRAGETLSRDGAIRLALGEPAHAVVEGRQHGGSEPLARREAEVARLVADGLSNKQIGARLFISERTVENHVGSILNKLGFNSRVQIAGWIASSNH